MKKITFLVAALCATTMAFATATGVKVTDLTTLKAGDKIAITNFDGTKAMSIEQTTVDGKSYYRGSAAFDAANVTSDVELIELVASGENFKLKVTGGFLYYDATWTKNWLGTNETGTDFKFEATGDTLRVVEAASGRYIMYNTTEARFAAYATTSSLRSVGTAIYVVTGEPEKAVIEHKTIAEFIAAKGVKCYLTGVVGKIDNNEYGNFNLTDKSGTIYVYGCLTAEKESKKFSTLGVKEGDTLTVLAEKYQVYKEQEQLVNAIYVSHTEGTGSSDGGDEDGDTDYSFEPTEKTAIDETMTDATWVDYTSDYGIVSVYMENDDFGVELYVVTNKAAMPVGEFAINDTEEENTVIASIGGDEEYDYPSCVYTDYDEDGYYNAAYYLISGSLTIEQNGENYNITLDAVSYNGSTIKMAYKGIVDEYTAIRNIEVLNDVYAHEGHIYTEEGAQIYTVMGLNVTEQNKKSTLGEGIYIVKAGNKLAKIVVK